MEQLDIFDVLNEFRVQDGQSSYKEDLKKLVQMRVEEMGIAEYFPIESTKIHVDTDADSRIVRVELLSEQAYLKDCVFYPGRPDLYDYYISRMKLLNEINVDTVVWCSFNDRSQLYDGIYYWSNQCAERSIESVIMTGFQGELR